MGLIFRINILFTIPKYQQGGQASLKQDLSIMIANIQAFNKDTNIIRQLTNTSDPLEI